MCPLATLNMFSGNTIGSRKLTKAIARRTDVVGIILLSVLVPARHFFFNVDALALGVTVIAVCALAILGGLLFDMKAGFCNSLCPILPVERLYGQRPLLRLSNTRCTSCTACSKRCLDLSPAGFAKGLAEGKNRDRHWATTTYGAFALAFPGFITAFYNTSDTEWLNAASVYGFTVLCAVGSWIVLTVIFLAGRVSRETALVVCGGFAVGLYYWYTPLAIADQFGLPGAFVWTIRISMLGLVGTWFCAPRPVRKTVQ